MKKCDQEQCKRLRQAVEEFLLLYYVEPHDCAEIAMAIDQMRIEVGMKDPDDPDRVPREDQDD